MNRETHSTSISDPLTVPGTQTQIGAGTFLVSRQYGGRYTACDLLQQRVQQAAHNIIHWRGNRPHGIINL